MIQKLEGKHTTTVQIPLELWNLMKKHGVRPVDAMRAGIPIKLAERGVEGFDNPLTYKRRVLNLTKILDETMQELNKLKDKKNA